MRNIRNQRTAGFPLTVQRRLLLRLIQDAAGHVDAKELHRRACSADRSISLATVYRNLRRFRDLGMIDERQMGQLGRRYEARHGGKHQHFVCRDCGAVIEFQSPLIARLVGAVQAEQGFTVTRTELCLEGQCPRCRETSQS